MRFAATGGNVELAKLLVDKDVLNPVPPYYEEVLELVNYYGYTQFVEFLVSLNIYSKSQYSSTLLRAARVGNTKIVALLIEKGADATAKDNDAIKRASARGYTKMVELLIKAGADYSECEETLLADIFLNSGDKKVIKIISAEEKFEK